MRRNRCVTHITVIELALWMLLLAKYNSGGETVRGVVRQHTCNFRQNQPRIPVRLEMIKRCFCCDYIVLAILSDLIPHIFWNWLIPRQTKFLMMNTEFNLEFLQALFVCCRCEVINIRIRDIVCLTEQIAIIVIIDDSGR